MTVIPENPDSVRKKEGFDRERLFVLPEPLQAELSEFELTRDLFVSDIGCFPRARHHYRERPEGSAASIFIFCAEGEGWLESQGVRPIRVPAEHLIVIPAGTPHRYWASSEDPWSLYWFHLAGGHASSLIRLYGLDDGPLRLPLGAQSSLRSTFEQSYDLLSARAYSLQIHTHVSQSIRQLISSIGIAGIAADRSDRERYLRQAVTYMSERLECSIRLPELARHVGVSKQHLTLLFNEETGMPPIEYFLRLKMQRAAQILALTDRPVKEIAAELGIADPYYFSRLFKKRIGTSPSAYRSVPKG